MNMNIYAIILCYLVRNYIMLSVRNYIMLSSMILLYCISPVIHSIMQYEGIAIHLFTLNL